MYNCVLEDVFYKLLIFFLFVLDEEVFMYCFYFYSISGGLYRGD